MLDIVITTVPHDKQRYDTVGDYQTDGFGKTVFRVSDMRDWRYEFLVAVHEQVEQALCRKRGIPEELIDQFDLDFEAKRPEGSVAEPGDDPGAPYHREHFFATNIERLLAAELGVNWEEYEETINSL